MIRLHHNRFQSVPGPDDITRVELPNGIILLVRTNFNSPSIVISGYLQAGSIYDPKAELGLANFTASALMRGSASRNYQEIYDILESTGASLGLYCATHTIGISGMSLAEDLQMMVDLLADVLFTPTFPERQIEQLRAQLLTSLDLRSQSTGEMASLTFEKLAYAGHPYSLPEDGEIETIKSITRQDMIGFHQKHYGPKDTVLAIVGAVPVDQVVQMVSDMFGGWVNPDQPETMKVPDVQLVESGIDEYVFVPGKSQSDIIMGMPGPPRNSPDFIAASLGNSILGQFGMYGRLGDVIRDQSGLAYYATSSLSGGIGPGPWVISAGVNPSSIEQTKEMIREEIYKFTTELVTEEELDDNKANYIGRIPLTLESNAGVAGSLINLERYQLGLDYFYRYADIINAVDQKQVLAAAQHYWKLDRLVSVVAGPRQPVANRNKSSNL